MADGEFPQFVHESPAPAAAAARVVPECASDAAVTAAFMRFHRKAGLVVSSTCARAFLGGGGWAFLGLAVISFTGGLLLALFPFNTPERPITIAGHAPEMLYTRPANNDAGSSPAAVTAVAAAPETESAGKERQAIASETEQSHNQRVQLELASSTAELAALSVDGEAPLPDAATNLAAAMRLGAVTATHSGSRGGSDVAVGYDAVELPSVPEPATGWIVALGLGALIGFSKLVRTRRNTRL